VLPVGLYVLLGALGVPVFHNGITGIGVLLGPTGGFLIGFIAAALFTGLAYEYQSKYVRIAGLAAGTLVIYGCGVTWLMISLGMTLVPAVVAGAVPFIPGDAIKAGAAYIIGKQLV
jgi:biotin transport system substrate-specific component